MVVADLPNYVDHVKYELLWLVQTGIPRAMRWVLQCFVHCFVRLERREFKKIELSGLS
jgi:hypothetical protein